MSDYDRFILKVIKTSDSECWQWSGCKDKDGYSIFSAIINGAKKNIRAHRWSYEYFIGKIPEGKQIDHLCRNRWCVNPHHMEPVTPRENTLRGESPSAKCVKVNCCIKGHPLTAENTRIDPNGKRRCIECRRIFDRKKYWKRIAEVEHRDYKIKNIPLWPSTI